MRKQKGDILLALIIALLVTSVLTTGIIVINVTSGISAAKSANFTKALYLAEAGVRYGADQIQGTDITYTMSDSYQRMNIRKQANGTIVSTGIAYPGTVYEARMTINRGAGTGPLPPNDTRDNNRNLLPLTPATFTGGDLGVFDLAGISDRVAIQAYQSAGGAGYTHAYWAALLNFTTHTGADGDNPGCNFGYLFVPINQTYVSYLRDSYNTYGQVSYSMQTKLGWLNTLNYAAQGINFRWHEHPSFPGKYQGYAVSYMVFHNQAGCSDDFIPNSIKPGTSDTLSGRLLLVLWKQWVDGGMERRKWLAYAELGRPAGVCTPPGCTRSPADNDPMVTGRQDSYDGRVNDDATIGVRIEDVVWGTTHHNEIKVFYADASPYFGTSPRRGADEYATNTKRQRYFPQWINSVYFTTWPSHFFENLSSTDNMLTYWSYCGWLSSTPYVLNGPGGSPEVVIPTMRKASDGQPHHYTVTQAGTSGLTEPPWPTASGDSIADGTVTWRESGTARPSTAYDYFTVANTVTNPQGTYNPQGPYNTVRWVLNPAATEITLGTDRSTIRTYEFPLSSFPSGRKEIGLHGMVNGDAVPLAFDDISLTILGKKE